jgi:hypothetical protein
VAEQTLPQDRLAPSRRTFITRAAAMTAGVTLGATGSLSPASAGVSPELTALIARAAELDEINDLHDDRITHGYGELRARAGEGCEIMKYHASSAAALQSLDRREQACRGTISKLPTVASMKQWEKDLSLQCAEERLAGILAKRAAINEYDRAFADLGMAELIKQDDTASSDLRCAEDAVIAFPVATLADCIAKLRFCIQIGEHSEDALDVAIADMARISGVAVTTPVEGV